SATNAAEAEEITQDLAHGPRALLQPQTKSLCLGSSPLSLSLHRRIWLRPLTVKLSGRVSAPRALQSVFVRKARSAPPYPSLHGPLERWLERTHRPSTVRAPRESGKPQRTSRRVKRAAEP